MPRPTKNCLGCKVLHQLAEERKKVADLKTCAMLRGLDLDGGCQDCHPIVRGLCDALKVSGER